VARQVTLWGAEGRGRRTLTLRFDAHDWHVPQRVTVAALEDAWVEGDHVVSLAHRVTGASPATARAAAVLPVYITDTTVPGLSIATLAHGVTGEVFSENEYDGRHLALREGEALTLLLALTAPPPPDAYVHVELTYHDLDDESTLSLGGNLTRWKAHRVTLTAASNASTVRLAAPVDGVVKGNKDVTVDVMVHSPITPYNELMVPPLTVTVNDADAAGLVLKPSHDEFVAVDGNAPAYVNVSLAARPPSLVRVTWALEDDSSPPVSASAVKAKKKHGEVSFSPTRWMLFYPETWHVPQTLQLKAQEDGEVTGPAAATLTLAATCPGCVRPCDSSVSPSALAVAFGQSMPVVKGFELRTACTWMAPDSVGRVIRESAGTISSKPRRRRR
jgi:hypothetical protein